MISKPRNACRASEGGVAGVHDAVEVPAAAICDRPDHRVQQAPDDAGASGLGGHRQPGGEPPGLGPGVQGGKSGARPSHDPGAVRAGPLREQ